MHKRLKTHKNLRQRVGPRHARIRRMLRVAPVPLRAFDTEPCPPFNGISEDGSEEQAIIPSSISSFSTGKQKTPYKRVEVRASATEIANSIRSIGYDRRSLEYEPDADIRDLAGAVATDLQASARHLCERSAAGLRTSAWDISQATEKALKLLIRRKGQTPPFTHDLQKLADRVKALSAVTINRTELDKIPSNNAATGMRYGGEITLADAMAAYRAALPIIRDLLFEAKPDTEVNAREARFKIQRPPWFDFDTQAFSDQIRSGKSKAASD